jgi:Na+-translocating ferredoxin:NAD+ oxidoreductase RnfD subunit
VRYPGGPRVTEVGTVPVAAPAASLRARLGAVTHRIPPTRALWILLAILAGYGVWFLGTGIGIAAAIGLPILAAAVDLVFQRIRFDRARFPDAAIATGLFLALLFPPVVPALAAGAATVSAITLRHVLRSRGRPWLNPAAAGMVIGAVFFGLSPAWWGAINEELVVALGVILLLWQLRNWRLPVVFLGSYAALAIVERVIFSVSSGIVLVPMVLFLSAVDPAVLFFGLFMVAEPRTAPSAKGLQPIYAVSVAAGAALLPLVLPTISALVGLLVGNLLAVAMRSPAFARAAPVGRTSGTGAGRSRAAEAASLRWSPARRIGAGFAVFFVIAILASAGSGPSSHGTPLVGSRPISGGGTAVSATQCSHDNGSISATSLSSLHKTLGPSVILSYNPATNLVVFYDPVNSVTVTETDLYEDFGFAEFNGDDYTSVGCVPP